MSLQALIGIIATAFGLLMGFGGLLWRSAMLASKINQNESQITELKSKFKELDAKLDERFSELLSQNNTIVTTLARMEERMNMSTAFNRRINDFN